jgi:hypothetical protein
MSFASQRKMHKALSYFDMFFNATAAENLKGSSIKVGSGAYLLQYRSR